MSCYSLVKRLGIKCHNIYHQGIIQSADGTVGAFWGVHKHWLKPVYLSITDGVALCKFMNAVRQTDRQRERQTDTDLLMVSR